MSELQLNLPNFDGPLDLLLHLIKSQKIDIYDIPVAQITGQYLGYLKQMQNLNLNIAGEYFVMASSLLRIKSSMLLPKNEFVDDEELPEDYDPRQELVDQLVQYELFQKISRFLQEQDEQTTKVLTKEPDVAPKNLTKPLPTGLISRDDLTNTFAAIMERFKLRQPQMAKIDLTETSITEQVDHISALLLVRSELSFFALIKDQTSIDYVINVFLAVLELIKKGQILVSQSEKFDDLILKKVGENE